MEPSDRVARQVEFLAGFDLKISYLKGDKNVVADALSRLPSAALNNAEVEAAALSAMVPIKRDWMDSLGSRTNILVRSSTQLALVRRAQNC